MFSQNEVISSFVRVPIAQGLNGQSPTISPNDGYLALNTPEGVLYYAIDGTWRPLWLPPQPHVNKSHVDEFVIDKLNLDLSNTKDHVVLSTRRVDKVESDLSVTKNRIDSTTQRLDMLDSNFIDVKDRLNTNSRRISEIDEIVSKLKPSNFGISSENNKLTFRTTEDQQKDDLNGMITILLKEIQKLHNLADEQNTKIKSIEKNLSLTDISSDINLDYDESKVENNTDAGILPENPDNSTENSTETPTPKSDDHPPITFLEGKDTPKSESNNITEKI